MEECERHKYFTGWGFTDIQVRGSCPQYFLNRFEGVDFDSIIQDGDLAYMKERIKPDFISLTSYFATVIAEGEKSGNAMSAGHVNPYCDHTEWGWSVEPYGFSPMFMEYWHRYQLSILILENGLGHRDQLVEEDGVRRVHDQNRINFFA